MEIHFFPLNYLLTIKAYLSFIGRVEVISTKTVINLPRTYLKLHHKGGFMDPAEARSFVAASISLSITYRDIKIHIFVNVLKEIV